jgi:hypothetical protein
MNNLQGSGLTAMVEPAQKIVPSDSTVLSEGITTTDLKAATERINSDLKLRSKENSPVAVLFDEESRAQPQSQMVSTAKLLSKKESDSTKESDPTPNADSSGIPKELMPAVKAYRTLAYRGTSQRGMINLIGALLNYAKTQKISDEETLKLYQKLHSDVIQSPRLEDACGRVMENFCSALTAFMPQALEQKYGKQTTVIKLAADEYTEGLKRHLKELPQKLGSIELDSLAKEAALVYFQKTFEACKEEAIPKEDQKALLKYVLKMKANAEFKFSTKFLLTILENPKEILGIAKDFLGGLTAKIAKDPKLSGFLYFITDSVKHGLSLPDSGRTSLQV